MMGETAQSSEFGYQRGAMGDYSDVDDELELYNEFDAMEEEGDEIEDEVDDSSYGNQSDGDPSEA